MGHRHRWDRIEAAGYQASYLACACGAHHPDAVTEHRWRRPGARGAHGRPVACSCHGIEIPPVVQAACGNHGVGPHRLRVRARPRSGLAWVCQACERERAAEREIDPEVSRAASRAYQARLRAAKGARRGR